MDDLTSRAWEEVGMMKPQTFKPKQKWQMLGVTYTLNKLPEVMGLSRRQLEYQLAVDQRDKRTCQGGKRG